MNTMLERLEKATGPDRELDCLLAVAIGGFHTKPPKYEGGDVLYCRYDQDGTLIMPGQAGDMMVPRYTASIDAALTLMPPGWEFELTNLYGVASATVPLNVNDVTQVTRRRKDGNIVLALLAAILEARDDYAKPA